MVHDTPDLEPDSSTDDEDTGRGELTAPQEIGAHCVECGEKVWFMMEGSHPDDGEVGVYRCEMDDCSQEIHLDLNPQ